MLSSILSGRFLQRGTGAVLAELVFLLGVGLLLGLGAPARSLAVVEGGGPARARRWGWMAVVQLALRRGVVLASALPLANVFLSAFAVVFVGYLSTDREKIRLRRDLPLLRGRERDGPRCSTTRSCSGSAARSATAPCSSATSAASPPSPSSMSPEALVKFINDYLSPMTHIVLEEGGTLDKYIGDALMAFWGAPVPQQDHALRACRAALALPRGAGAAQPRLARPRAARRSTSASASTPGPWSSGNMGSDLRFDYTVMGDAVNLASRLEGANKLFQTSIIVSEETWNRVASQVTGRRLGSLRLRGRSEPVRVWELLGVRPPTGEEQAEIARFEAAVDALAARRLHEAEAGFQAVLAARPEDRVARRYLAEARTAAV